MFVEFGGISRSFSGSGTTWSADKADGSTLTVDAQGHWIYTDRAGTQIQFDNSSFTEGGHFCPGSDSGSCHIPQSITRPDGVKFTLTWNTARLCTQPIGVDCGEWMTYKRLASVTSSAGYKFTIAYLTDVPGSGTEPQANWYLRSTVTFDNTANHPSSLPAIAYAYGTNTVSVTDPGGRTWTFTTDASGRLSGIKRPGSASNNISYAYGADGTVNSSTKDGVTNTYGRSVVGSTATETLTNPLSQQTVVETDTSKGRPTSYKDGLNRTTAYVYDANSRLTKITAPEGNYAQYAYDARGNLTTTTNVAKAGSGLANIVISASFDATCANIVKCNKPNSATDAKGNVTDYTYDATHGGVLTVTQPAAATGGVRPQTRLTYTQVTSASGDLVYMQTKVAACQTLASCTAAADETQRVTAYNSNLLPTSVTRQSGDLALVSTTGITYDSHGNVSTVNGPLSDTFNGTTLTLTDTTMYLYDGADQLVETVLPDPDGYGTSGGPLPSRATKLTYRSDGQISKQELGTAAADGSGFTALQTIDMTFDGNNRQVTSKLSASNNAYALTAQNYDALGRVNCSAVRMDTSQFTADVSLDACTLGANTDPKDRISKAVYDAAGEVVQNRVAVGVTGEEAAERTLSYTSNGQVQYLIDADGQKTQYVYDGFDRQQCLIYPSMTRPTGYDDSTQATALATAGSVSGDCVTTGDYEKLTYDANSNVLTRRLRDGTSIAFTYDKLDRATLKDLPGTEPDVTYGYDLLGRLAQANQSGNNLTFTWDALSRNLTQVRSANTHVFTVALSYDAAGRRTQLSYPAAANPLTITYDYLTTGEITALKQSGAALATYAYDNLGNRTSLTFANGVVQNYTWDPVSRLASLSNDLSGTANDLAIGTPATPITYNPASQMTSVVRTGDPYAFTGLGSGTTSTTTNGLNQQVSIGGGTATWDSKGNLTTDPTSAKIYGYSSENLLTAASGGVTLGYDSLTRLYQVAGASTTRFLYDGLDAISEYDGNSALLRRFVVDPATHQPLVWFEGTGNDSAAKRYLSADERGSVISVTDSSGALLGINTYDEYGKPSASNIGRFQYTGQKWLSEVGAYDYKARVYLPHLGVFAQTDPIGSKDSPNVYAYVRNDPVNKTDPTGRCIPACLVPGVIGGFIGLGAELFYQWYTTGHIDTSWTGLGQDLAAAGNGALAAYGPEVFAAESALARVGAATVWSGLIGGEEAGTHDVIAGQPASNADVLWGMLAGSVGGLIGEGAIAGAPGPVYAAQSAGPFMFSDSAGSWFTVAEYQSQIARDFFGGLLGAGISMDFAVYDANGNSQTVTLEIPEADPMDETLKLINELSKKK